jgi:mono/diheme cytochrome c family protein
MKHMKDSRLIALALVLVVLGAIGLVLVLVFGGGAPSVATSSSAGQRIYYTGADANGPIPKTAAGGGMMGPLACVNCHGQDGRGGRVRMMMFGTVDVPDIRYSTLTTTRSEEGATVPAWTDAGIARAIRDGVEPDGQRLKAPMQRWSMTDADIADVIAYLKELSAR